MLSKISPCITHWVGVRSQPAKPQSLGITLFWAFVGAFGGLSVLQAVFGHSQYFINRGVPQLVASYGATAVLIYGLPEAPLAQPRAVVGGHFISAVVGLIVLEIFRSSGHENTTQDGISDSLSWLAASLATAIAIVGMLASKTTHPPAGATALLPILEPTIYRLRWYLLPVVLLSSTLMVLVGLITNNAQRRYPTFWWEPASSPAQPSKQMPTSVDGANGKVVSPV